MDKTTAPASSSGAFIDDNPGGGIVGTLIVAADQNAHQDEIYNSIVGAAITPSSASNAQLLLAIKRLAIEYGKQDAEIYPLPYQRDATAWAGNADTYFPDICLSDIETYRDITLATHPTLVPILRAIKTGYLIGQTGEKTAFDVTNWAIATNVATLTFANTAAEIAFLAALSEDQVVHNSYTNWRSITLASAIGSSTAGEYAITAINSAARTVSFSFVAANGSGAVTATAEF